MDKKLREKATRLLKAAQKKYDLPVTAEDCWMEGMMALQEEGDYKLALQQMNKALKLMPRMKEALIIRAEANIGLGEWEKALEDTLAARKGRRFQKEFDLSGLIPWLRAAAFWNLRRWAESITSVHEAVSTKELDRTDFIQWCLSCLCRGEWERLPGAGCLSDIIHVDAWITCQPKDFESIEYAAKDFFMQKASEETVGLTALIGLGGIQMVTQNYSGALASFSRATVMDPDSAAAHEGYGHTLFWSGDLKGCVKHFTKAIQLWPNSVYCFSRRGSALVYLDQPARAIKDLKRAQELGLNDYQTLAHLSLALWQKGCPEEALQKVDMAIERYGDARLYLQRGDILADLEREDEAKEDYLKALENAVRLCAEDAPHIEKQARQRLKELWKSIPQNYKKRK